MKRFVAGWLLLLLLALPAAGAEISLQEALRGAIADQLSVKTAKARAEAAEAAIDEARSGWLPHLSLSERYTRTDEPGSSLFLALNQERNVMADPSYDLVDPDDKDDFETRLQLSQILYDPTVDFGLRQARMASQVAAAETLWNMESAAFHAFQAYLDVQQASAALAWTESSRQEAEEIHRLSRERYRAGTGLKADELRAKVQMAEARRRELAARNDLTLARRRLALATGQPSGEIGITSPLRAEGFPVGNETVTSQRADIEALSLQVDSAQLSVRKSKADWFPRASLTAHYARHDAEYPFSSGAESWAVGAGMTWELFDGLRRNAATARATAEQLVATNKLEDARREQNFRLAEARLRAEEAALQEESARQAVTAADESRRLLQQRFETGLADLADLLAVQSAFDRARYDAVIAEHRHLLALGNIHFQAGCFLQTFLSSEETAR